MAVIRSSANHLGQSQGGRGGWLAELAENSPGCFEHLFERTFASLEHTAADERVLGSALQDRLEVGDFLSR
jgi:hypothetical protein